MTLTQYLARLAAEATTVISAFDYGRTVYDLAVRRDLIAIGEEMVNVAFDAPVDFAPRDQIESAERRLYDLAESAVTAAASRRSTARSPLQWTWRPAPTSARASFQVWPPGCETSTPKWEDCSRRTLSSSPAALAWARPHLPRTSPTTSLAHGKARFEPMDTS